MKPARYTYDHKHGKKTRCPQCGKEKRFTMWFDHVAGCFLPERFGVCDRVNSCGYSLNPYDNREWLRTWEAEHRDTDAEMQFKRKVAMPPAPPSTMPSEWVPASMARGDNSLTRWMKSFLPPAEVDRVVRDYRVGTTKDGNPIFWLIDTRNGVRTGKVITYGENGRRIKEKPPYFVHKVMGDSFNRVSVPFGTHLDPFAGTKPCAVVESEKTALIMAVLRPEWVWLAVGGSTQLSKMRPMVPMGATLFADDDEAGRKWIEWGRENGHPVSDWWDMLDDRGNGADVADLCVALGHAPLSLLPPMRGGKGGMYYSPTVQRLSREEVGRSPLGCSSLPPLYIGGREHHEGTELDTDDYLLLLSENEQAKDFCQILGIKPHNVHRRKLLTKVVK